MPGGGHMHGGLVTPPKAGSGDANHGDICVKFTELAQQIAIQCLSA